MRQDLSLYTREKGLRARTVEFLKLLALEVLLILVLVLPAALAAGKLSFRNVFRSFSNRVYASFFAVALVPLLLFTVFTRGLFDRIFTGRFVEEAALHAGFARSIMEDFIYLQDGGRPGLPSPPEDLVLWVAATLSNDVNLYRDAKLLSSSRREFFDAGLLPDLVDGAIYHRLVVEKAPFTTQRKRIGGIFLPDADRPLRAPAAARSSISMPFPFEKEEAARATGELVEFLFFLSLLFAGLVFVFARGIRAMIVVPVRKLLAGTREVSLGNLDVAIEHPSRDEMRTLVDGFNAMVGSLRAHRQELAEMGKKVAWAEMARKVAHEIKNPLTPIQLSAEHVLRVYEDRDGDFEKTLRESMSYIIGEVEHLRRVAQEFMEIARDTSVRRDPCDLRRIVEETLDPYRKLLSARIRFRESYEGTAAAVPRRRGQAEDGVPEHRGQRHRGHPGQGRDHGRSSGGRGRPGGSPSATPGPGMTPDRPRQDLRALFLDQGRRHRTRPSHHPEDRRGPRRHRPGGERAGEGNDGHRRAPCRSLEFRPVLWNNRRSEKGRATWPKCS